jgi:hypothetical protein
MHKIDTWGLPGGDKFTNSFFSRFQHTMAPVRVEIEYCGG